MGSENEKSYWEHFKNIKPSNTDNCNYLDFVDNLPKIPEDLIEYDIEKIERFRLIYSAKLMDYKSYDYSPKEMYDFLAPHFPYPIRIKYQLIKEQLPIHVDHMHVQNQRPFIFNYVLFSGGSNVRTRHWKLPDKLPIGKHNIAGYQWHPSLPPVYPAPFWGNNPVEGMNLLNENTIPEKTWCRLNISIPHDISEIDLPRLILTVF